MYLLHLVGCHFIPSHMVSNVVGHIILMGESSLTSLVSSASNTLHHPYLSGKGAIAGLHRTDKGFDSSVKFLVANKVRTDGKSRQQVQHDLHGCKAWIPYLVVKYFPHAATSQPYFLSRCDLLFCLADMFCFIMASLLCMSVTRGESADGDGDELAEFHQGGSIVSGLTDG